MTDEELVKLLWPTRADAEAAFKRILDSAFPVREQPEPNISKCPKCGGPADNGHDREIPPNPYYCTKCEQPAQPEPEIEIDEAVYEAAEATNAGHSIRIDFLCSRVREGITAAIRKHEELRRQACHTPESQSSPSSSDSPSAPSAGGAFGRRSSSDTADESPSGLRSGSPDEATDEELWSAFNLATGKPYQLSGDRTTRGIRAVYNLGRERWAVVSMQAILDCTPNGAHGMAVVDYLRSAGVRLQ